MTAVVRSLPGLVDEAHRPTEPIPVLQVVDVDADDYDVRLDVSGHVDLIALADALVSDHAAWAEWRVLRANRSASPARRIMAAAELRRIPAIRAALTIALTPAEAGLAADSLAERLEQAALEPARCEHWEGCNRFVEVEDTLAGMLLCAEHYTDVEEHGPEWDRGSYPDPDEAS